MDDSSYKDWIVGSSVDEAENGMIFQSLFGYTTPWIYYTHSKYTFTIFTIELFWSLESLFWQF